jgi:hypothetical protein
MKLKVRWAVCGAGFVCNRLHDNGADTTYPTALKLDRLTAVVFGGCDRGIGMHDVRLLNLDVEDASDNRRQTRSLDNERNDALKILARSFVTGCRKTFQNMTCLVRQPPRN